MLTHTPPACPLTGARRAASAAHIAGPWLVGKFSLNPGWKADGGTKVLIASQCNYHGCRCGTLPHVNPYHTRRLDDTPAVQRRGDTCASCTSTIVDQDQGGLACSGGTPDRRWGGVFPTRRPAKRDHMNMPKPSTTALFTAVPPNLVKNEWNCTRRLINQVTLTRGRLEPFLAGKGPRTHRMVVLTNRYDSSFTVKLLGTEPGSTSL